MQVEFQCVCGTRMRTSADNVGKRTRCAKCQAPVLIVPLSSSSSSTAPTAPRPAADSKVASSRVPRPAVVKARSVVAAKPVAPAAPAFDPLELGDLSFPMAQFPVDPTWSSTTAYSAPRRKRTANTRWLWIGLGIGALCLIAVIGVGTVVLAISRGRAVVASRTTGGAFSSASIASVRKPFGPPVSSSEAEEVVRRYVQAVYDHDFGVCKALFSMDRIYEEIADEAKMSSNERRQFLASARSQTPLWMQLQPVIGVGGEYVVLRPIQRGSELRVVVRLSSQQTGLNYHEYILRRADTGQAEIADVYVMTAGNTLGESMRRMVMTLLAGRSTSLLGRLGGADKQLIQNSKTLEKIKQLSKGAPKLALNEYKNLPLELQQEKTMMILKLQLCAEGSPGEYAATFEEFQRLFPGDKSIDLLSIDYYIARNDHQSAIASAERLNAHVGGDPFLEQLIIGLRSK